MYDLAFWIWMELRTLYANRYMRRGNSLNESQKAHFLVLSLPETVLGLWHCVILCKLRNRVFPGGSAVKNSPAMKEMWVQSLGQQDPLEEGMATHYSSLAWRIPLIGEPGRLQSITVTECWIQPKWLSTHTEDLYNILWNEVSWA